MSRANRQQRVFEGGRRAAKSARQAGALRDAALQGPHVIVWTERGGRREPMTGEAQ